MQTPESLNLTEAQFKNIAKLTVFVRDSVPPPTFDIQWFFQSEENIYHANDGVSSVCPTKEDYGRGTSACFAGYAILAGIEPQEHEKWGPYLCRVFGLGQYNQSIDSDVYQLLFSHEHENDKDAAINRGAYFLMNGLPKTTDIKVWETPDNFIPDWKSIEEIANS